MLYPCVLSPESFVGVRRLLIFLQVAAPVLTSHDDTGPIHSSYYPSLKFLPFHLLAACSKNNSSVTRTFLSIDF